ncbi:NADPH:quinone oxidoreductase family protein [Deinococcus pimensis]|uniref:NADPH:quinone oxidoreductase family protein n=1 Tax=Deinococcus pimensis TaxID=309888 RepID=UPI0004AFD394|nr:NADPH:quinone oxidoreductase family protein [Deinococcus pimensis]
MAEKVFEPASKVMSLPEGVDLDVEAGLKLAFGKVMHAMVDRATVREYETLVVLGAVAGVGLAAVMIGRALGARVVAAASTPEKLDVTRAHGAHDTIDYAREDLRERVKALTGGRGPDVIFDPVGGSLAEPAFRSIGWGGRYLVVGFAGGDIPALPLNLPLLKGASLVGVFWGEFARRDPAANARNLTRLAGWVADGTVRPLVSARYALADTPAALTALLERRVTGKVIVTP